MLREAPPLEARQVRRRRTRNSVHALEALPRPPVRVVDVALSRGERSGAIRTYIDAKAAWAKATGLIEHHVIVPGLAERHEDGRHQLPASRLPATKGHRLPVGAPALLAALRDLRPDVVILHDPLWRPLRVMQTAQDLGARVVAVHHGSTAVGAAGLPGPDALWRPILRTWMRHAYREADAVMSAVDSRADCGRRATIGLRFGLDAAFVPQPAVRRQDHVLYVGRLSREKGVSELLHAAARSAEPWQLKLVGRGPMEKRLRRLAQQLGIEERVHFHPFIDDRARLAGWYASARAVVMPGAHETFGLVALEAAASGACVVTCSTAPSAALMRGIVRTYEPGDTDGLLAAIEAARAAQPDAAAAAALARRHSWGAAFASETMQLERLAGRARR
ncbi:MAG TPA: glycosyltransferase [Solirubrobacteraceae bacterium]|nr:glycosyltransferase [Solirubrobacteraceae bacterium]